MTEAGDISRQIWDLKYRHRALDGRPLDASIEESWWRVARAAASPEAEPEPWSRRFYDILADFRFLPAGRILAGAGTGRAVTLFNCFVMGRIPDSMAGIFEHLKEAALTLQQGGGIGYDFSTLRPQGAPVAGVGADASGPLSFMDVWDVMCRTIMSAGSRRGAMMATLRCDHPDIEAFVEAKRDPARLRMFNLSVLVTDAFMRAVAEDAGWNLVFEGTAVRSLPARALWERITRATYDVAEPGVIFIDRINDANNLAYAETIAATNPCVTADTWVLTTDGPRQVRSLAGRSFTAVVDGRPHHSGPAGFVQTGVKPVLRLATREGHALRLTADHPVLAVVEQTRFRLERAWRPAGTLKPGDSIVLHDHSALPGWPGPYGEDEGYLIGLLIGDGTLKADKAVLSVWPGAQAVNGGWERSGVAPVMARAMSAARTLPHRSDFLGWMAVPGRGEMRLALGAVRDLARTLGLEPGGKAITAAIEQGSSDFCCGFLRGLFDCDGTVIGSQAKGVSVRLAQSDLDRLRAVQRMLLRLGVVARIYPERPPAGLRRLPDGKGGSRLYSCRADHELIVSGINLVRFAERVGFTDSEKAGRLASLLGGYRRALNRERFLATVESTAEDGVEPVFDVQIPGVNTFDANGLHVHNCGEQPLPPYGACLLGSVNLARLVEAPFTAAARLDTAALAAIVAPAVRLLDNVIDISGFALEAQAQEARAKRRIGLGITGLADALMQCGVRYDSPEAARLTGDWLRVVRDAAYAASAALAAEKGAFPLFDRDAYLDRPMLRTLDPALRAEIAEHGIRNALLTSIAPTGTISLLAGNVSSGIEPAFGDRFRRAVLLHDGSRRIEEVEDYAVAQYRRLNGSAAILPPAFVDAGALTPSAHLAIQAAAQPFIDSAISKTINCPATLDFAAFKAVYLDAYRLGCKGCTTYRPNPVTGAVLESALRPAEAGAPAEAAGAQRLGIAPGPRLDFGEADAAPWRPSSEVVYIAQPLDRPEALPGRTYKLRWPDSDHAIYVTVNDIVQPDARDGGGRRRPFEVFINSKNMEHYAWTVALTRMISAVFRRGGDVAFVVEELKAVFDPRGGHWMDGRYVPSLLAAIGEVIERHMVEIGFLPGSRQDEEIAAEARIAVNADAAPGRQCPKCGRPSLIRSEGCDLCRECGYSRCG